jgi:uncharacterized protein YkvS
MAKVSPVMKHAKPVRTAEQVAIEEFMDSIPPILETVNNVVVDNSIPETLVQEDTSLDPIVESVAVADTLDDMAVDVDQSTTAIAMESYRRLFGQITSMSGHPIQAGVSLESFPVTKGGKKQLAKAIRAHANTIRQCVNIALEDYVDQIDQKVAGSISNYKQALGELSRVNENSISMDGNVNIDHKAVWKLFHMNGKLMDMKDFGVEVDGVKTLAGLVSKGKDNILAMAAGNAGEGTALVGSDSVQLMSNTNVKIEGGRAVFEQGEVPPPDKSWSAGDWFWLFVFSWAGLVYRLIKGGNGDEKSKKKQSLRAIANVISEMKKMGPLVQGIENDVKAITGAIKKVPAEKQADLKRAASPVLELASKTINHVTEVTYGTMKMFKQAEKA